MNNTHDNNRPVHQAPGLRDAGFDELVKDVARIGPAPTASREAFAALVNIAVIVAAIFVLQPEPAVSAALAGFIGVYVAIRWIVGTRKWSNS